MSAPMSKPHTSAAQTATQSPALWPLSLAVAAVFVLLVGIAFVVFGDGIAVVQVYLAVALFIPALALFGVLFCVWMLFKKRPRTWVFWTNLGALVLLVVPALQPFQLVPIAFPRALDAAKPRLTARLPADGPLRVAWGGDDVKHNYHAATPDQRWAYDLVIEPAFHGKPELESYGCYGKPVLAPVAGTVIRTENTLPDETPNATTNAAAPLGNHVAIQATNTQTYVLIAHLKPGSVVVKPGDELIPGQPIGACGNSGNTSEPHIHIHHQAHDPRTHPVGYALGLPLFFAWHDGPQMPLGGLDVDGERITPTGMVVTHTAP